MRYNDNMMNNTKTPMSHPKANDFYIDETAGSVVRWVSNDRVPFSDMLQEFLKAGLIDSQTVTNSNEAREQDTRKFLDAYRANYRGPTAEEKFEARAAFGAGATVVNVITGTSYVV